MEWNCPPPHPSAANKTIAQCWPWWSDGWAMTQNLLPIVPLLSIDTNANTCTFICTTEHAIYSFKYFWPPCRPSEARACSGNSWRSLQFQLQKTKHGNLLLVWFVKANRYMDVHWLSTEGGIIFHLSWKCQIRKRSICFRQFDPGNKGLEKVVRTRWQIEIRKLRSHHESKHAPCQQVWPRRGDQSIGVGKNKVARSGKNRGKKSSYRSPLNSRNIGQEGRILQTQDVVDDTHPSFC